jgi:long-subunit acyl-CoA synthetase (AMP-forming)
VAHPTRAEISSTLVGQTVASTFLDTVTAHPDRVALRWRDGDGWDAMTYGAYGDAAARVAAGLRDLGVAHGDRVMLMLRNVPEFHVLDTAVVLCGATPISIYNSSSVEQVEFLAGHSRARFAFVEDDDYFALFRAAMPALPELRAVGVVRGSGGDVGYDELLGAAPLDLEAATAAVRPDQLATVIYTSGTTGAPKGVMLTHQQVRFTAESLKIALGRPLAELAGTRVISYLPMAHVAERMTSHYGGILAAYEVITCADVGQVAGYLRDVRPQVFFGVPRVWEKIQSALLAALAADPDKLRQFEDGVAAPTSKRRRGLSSTRWRSRRCAARSASTRSSAPSAAPRRSPRSSSRGTAASECRCPRSTGCPSPGVRCSGPRIASSPAPSGRRSRGARSGSRTTARSFVAGATSSRAISTTRSAPPRPSTPRAGCTAATSGRSTTTATTGSSIARRS